MKKPRVCWRTSLATIVAAAIVLAAGSCAKQDGAPQPEGSAAKAARLQRLNELLQRQVELASGKDFYLVLDPTGSELTLMLSGATLQSYRVTGLQVGTPRVSWFGRRDARPWQDVVWQHGELDPPRAIDRLVVQARAAEEGCGRA